MKNTDKPRTPLVNIYAIRDIVAAIFLTPFTSANDKTAERSFRQMIQTEGNSFNENPQDYDLYRVADFDPVDGQIDNLDHNELIIKGANTANHAQTIMSEKPMSDPQLQNKSSKPNDLMKI